MRREGWLEIIEFWRWNFLFGHLAGIPVYHELYFVELEKDAPECEDEGVADEGFPWESSDWSAPSDFDDDECKAEGLYSASECEYEGELSAAEHVVDDKNDCE